MSLQAAIDDGSSYIKITTDGKKCFKYPSLGRSGKASRISINGGVFRHQSRPIIPIISFPNLIKP